MVRKSLFLGLTGTLVVVLAYLVFQGRRQEKREQRIRRPVEIVKDSKPTLTRILAPQDLEITEAKTELADGATKTARHHLVIRNNGVSTYHSVLIRFSYLGAGDRTLESKTWEATQLLQPGQARSMDEIVVPDLPAATLKTKIGILAADLEPPPPRQR
jgi:hypothetical protein